MLTSSEVKRIFRENGLTPKKWMGQNLLVDSYYLKRIAEAAPITEGDKIVEIGAGLGVLTQALIDLGAEVWAIEFDSGFYTYLEEIFARNEKVHLIHADALKFDYGLLASEIGSLRVTANLPYNISSRIIFNCFEKRSLFSSLTILLQKEVAQRLVAVPGTKDYGILSVLLGISARVRLLFDIPPGAFFPKPEVTSTLLQIHFPPEAPLFLKNDKVLKNLVKAASSRRKTLKNTVLNAIDKCPSDQIMLAAEIEHIDLRRRGESLSPFEFARFANCISDLCNQGGMR